MLQLYLLPCNRHNVLLTPLFAIKSKIALLTSFDALNYQINVLAGILKAQAWKLV